MQKQWSKSTNTKRARGITFSEKKVQEILKRMQHFFIHNKDYRVLINDLLEKATVKMFFYLDPPYVVTKEEQHYTKNFDEWKDHTDLKNILDKVHRKGHYFELSYDYDEKIEKMYRDGGYNVEALDFHYTLSSNHQDKKELVITNYDTYAGDEYLNYEFKETDKKQRSLF
jgi:site-specific DNA-adenine methylase